MDRDLGFWELLSLLGALQGVFLALVLATHARGNRTANRLLAVLVFLFSLHLLHIVLFWARAFEAFPHFWGVVWFFPYLYGVLLYLYARSLTEPGFRLGWPATAHFLPFLAFVLLFRNFYLSPAETKRQWIESSYEPRPGAAGLFLMTVAAVQLVHFTVYLLLGRRRIGSVGALQARWFQRLLVTFGVSFFCWFAYGFAVGLGLPYSRAVDYGATLAMTLSIYTIGYTGLRDPEIFLGPLRARGRYEGSSMSAADVERYRGRLAELMLEERPYTDASLRLEDLAALMEMPPHHLSQVINQGFGERFNDLVNRYRVQEAMRLLSAPGRRSESLLSIAFEVGFNNKTTFNQAFKKFAGTTPSRFRADFERQEL
jgi:AraC-like DNA-binding protein